MGDPNSNGKNIRYRVTVQDEDGVVRFQDLADQFLRARMPGPLNSNRTTLVDGAGTPILPVGPLVQLRKSAVLTTSYVASPTINTANANMLIVHCDLTLGSLTSCGLKVMVSHDNASWRPLTIANTGSVSADEYQAQIYNDVRLMIPATASLTPYTHIWNVMAPFAQVWAIGNGTVTNSLLYMAACVGVSL